VTATPGELRDRGHQERRRHTWIATSLTRDCCTTATRPFVSSPITAGAGVVTGGLRRTISTSSAVTSEADLCCAGVTAPAETRQPKRASFGRRHPISHAAVAIHFISNSCTTSRNIAVAFSANCRRDATWGERMAFPWELNLDRPYRDEKWPFPEQRAWGESTDPVFRGSAEKLDGLPADSENRQGGIGSVSD
jgi:hypothetical protein